MTTIGLLGGIASGKSTVARLLSEHGAVVLDADQIAHEVLATQEVQQVLAGRWGDAVIGEDGGVDRAAIADKVFGRSDAAVENRRFLESLIHPQVRGLLRSRLAECRAQGAPAVVLDVPLLLEAGYQDDCDLLLFVDAPEDQRAARAAERGWSADEFVWRESAQRPISEKREAATDIIRNDGPAGSLAPPIAKFWRDRVLANR